MQILNNTEIKPGDILLCYLHGIDKKSDELKHCYMHAGIVSENLDIYESDTPGVQTTTIPNMLSKYDHIAVLRNDELWSPDRLKTLDDFLKRKIGKKFNSQGMMRLPDRKEKFEETHLERIVGYFAGTVDPPDPDTPTYFCSQLVTSAFIEVGIIEESASIMFDPKIYSPESIATDAVFGFFTGYIVPDDEYDIPENDLFRNAT